MATRSRYALMRSIVPGYGAVTVERLGEGLVNETYRVVRDGRAYSLRIDAAAPGRPADYLSLDRAWEARVLEAAGSMGLAPNMEYCDVTRGILLQRWADGSRWTSAEIDRPSNVGRIAQLVRRIHTLRLPPPTREMSPSAWIDGYSSAITRQKLALPDEELAAAAGINLRRLDDLPAAAPVLCHSDLHTFNLIDDGAALTVLDWEYAHVTDPLWDLAGWISNNDLAEGPAKRLLLEYLGDEPTAGQAERLWRLAWLYDYICQLWSVLYVNSEASGTLKARVEARSRLLAARLKFRHTNGNW